MKALVLVMSVLTGALGQLATQYQNAPQVASIQGLFKSLPSEIQ